MKLLTTISLLAICLMPIYGENETLVDGTKPFDMVLRYDSLPSYHENNTVVKSGLVHTRWRRCNEDNCEMRTFSEYTEQLFFEFSYDDVRQFSFGAASIKTVGGRANAKILDYSHDMDERNGELIVLHNCDSGNGDNRSVVELKVPLTSEHVLEIGWVKYCGGGRHEKLDYGIVSKSLSEGMLSLRDNDDVAMFEPGVLSTRVYMKHLEEGYSQRFTKPKINVKGVVRDGRRTRNNGVGIDMKGSGFGDMVLGRDLSTLDMFYNCYEQGLYNISMNIEIPPFEGLQMHWMKDCGGGNERSINIGTRDGNTDVVEEGITMDKFSRRVRGLEEGIVTGKGSGTKAFFMCVNKGNTSIGSLSIGEITAISENERLGKVGITGLNKIYEKSPWGISGISEHGEVISGSARRMIGVSVRCLKKGLLRVSVRISIHDRKGVEWWFLNECPSRSSSSSSSSRQGIYITAASGTYVMMCLICGVILLSFGTKRVKRVDQ